MESIHRRYSQGRARVPDTDEMARYLRYVAGKGLQVKVDQMRHPWDNRPLATMLYDLKRQAVYESASTKEPVLSTPTLDPRRH